MQFFCGKCNQPSLEFELGQPNTFPMTVTLHHNHLYTHTRTHTHTHTHTHIYIYISVCFCFVFLSLTMIFAKRGATFQIRRSLQTFSDVRMGFKCDVRRNLQVNIRQSVSLNNYYYYYYFPSFDHFVPFTNATELDISTFMS